MTKTSLTALAVILLALPVVGQAQDSTRPAMPVLDFATADANGDGGITPDEWAAYAATLMQGRMGQGIASRADALLAAGDANGDGMLTRDELVAAMTSHAEDMHQNRGEGMRGRHGDGEGRHGWGRGHGNHRGADRGDNRGETGFGRAFSRIDRDNNGVISAEELADAQSMMERMGQRRGWN